MIVQTYNIALIQSIMMHEDILPTIIDDTWDGTLYQPDIEREIFLACVVENEVIGLYNLHWITGVTLQGHAHILKKYRKKYAVESCKTTMKWVLDNVRRCKKVEVAVPDVYPNVRQFVVTCGFTHEGTSRRAFQLNGELHDMQWFGITAEEMANV